MDLIIKKQKATKAFKVDGHELIWALVNKEHAGISDGNIYEASEL